MSIISDALFPLIISHNLQWVIHRDPSFTVEETDAQGVKWVAPKVTWAVRGRVGISIQLSPMHCNLSMW